MSCKSVCAPAQRCVGRCSSLHPANNRGQIIALERPDGRVDTADLALALIEAGGSDSITPPQEILRAAMNLAAGTVKVVGSGWVAVNSKKGLSLYHFFAPVEVY